MARATTVPSQFSAKHPPINEQTGTTYTLQLADDGAIVAMNNASAQTLTVPPNSSVPFDVGAQVLIEQRGAGQVTVSAGAGVTVDAAQSENLTRAQNSMAVLVKTGTDRWVLSGDLTS